MKDINEIVSIGRDIAKDLIQNKVVSENSDVLFPGWDEEKEPDNSKVDYNGIRRAAKAILAEGLTFDEGTKVPRRDIGYLLHYIFDMLEE